MDGVRSHAAGSESPRDDPRVTTVALYRRYRVVLEFLRHRLRHPLSKAPARPDVARMDFRFAGPGPEIDAYESSRCIREIEVRASAGFHHRLCGPGRNDPGTENVRTFPSSAGKGMLPV